MVLLIHETVQFDNASSMLKNSLLFCYKFSKAKFLVHTNKSLEELKSFKNEKFIENNHFFVKHPMPIFSLDIDLKKIDEKILPEGNE